MIYLIVMVYSRVSTSTLGLNRQVFTTLFSLMLSYILHKTGALFNPPNLHFTLDSEVSEDPPEFILTCVSKGGPATRVVWRRDGSQIIVNTSSTTNTLRVRGREGGVYRCTVSNSQTLSSTITLQVLCK